MNSIFFFWSDFESFVANEHNIDLSEVKLTSEKFNLKEALGFKNVSIFVDSRISEDDLVALKTNGCECLLLRCAGFNMLNVEKAKEIGLKVFRVASYSPESIAEFVFALILNLARKMNLQRRQHSTMQNGRSLDSMGFALKGRILGLHGYGKIGREVSNIARNGFGMKVHFFDPFIDKSDNDTKVLDIYELYKTSDIVSIHMPLNDETKHSVNFDLLSKAKDGIMIVNTARGGLIESEAMIKYLDSGKVSYFGTDVWGDDDKFDERLYRDNTFQADHVAFFTDEAVYSILEQTMDSLSGRPLECNIL